MRAVQTPEIQIPTIAEIPGTPGIRAVPEAQEATEAPELQEIPAIQELPVQEALAVIPEVIATNKNQKQQKHQLQITKPKRGNEIVITKNYNQESYGITFASGRESLQGSNEI